MMYIYRTDLSFLSCAPPVRSALMAFLRCHLLTHKSLSSKGQQER